MLKNASTSPGLRPASSARSFSLRSGAAIALRIGSGTSGPGAYAGGSGAGGGAGGVGSGAGGGSLAAVVGAGSAGGGVGLAGGVSFDFEPQARSIDEAKREANRRAFTRVP